MAISVSIFMNMIVSIMICFSIPVVGMILINRRSSNITGAFIAGMISFFVMQILIRLPLLQMIMTQIDLEDTWLVRILVSVLLGFTAALFETTGRVASIHWLVGKRGRGYYPGIAHGLGHGGIEAAMLVGINYMVYFVIALGLVMKGIDAKIFQSFGSLEQQVFLQMFLETPPYLFLVAGIERGLTMVFHIGMSLLIMEGFVKGKVGKYFLIVLGLHTALDMFTVLMSYLGLNIWLLEGHVALYAILAVIIVITRKKHFQGALTASDEAEEAVKAGY